VKSNALFLKENITRIYYGGCAQITNDINDNSFSCDDRQTCQLWRKLTSCAWAEMSCNRETVLCLDPFPMSVFHIKSVHASP
jgi:hypothetical protein